MDLLLGIVLMVFGVVTLVKKELKLSADKIARGTPATLAGILLVLALPISYVVQIALGLLAGAGTPVVSESTRAILTYAILVAVTIAALVVAFRGTNKTA